MVISTNKRIFYFLVIIIRIFSRCAMVNSDDEWEDDESEQYALEIQGYSNSSEETLVFDLVSKMKIIGIDTPNPIMQIDGHIFKGRA